MKLPDNNENNLMKLYVIYISEKSTYQGWNSRGFYKTIWTNLRRFQFIFQICNTWKIIQVLHKIVIIQYY